MRALVASVPFMLSLLGFESTLCAGESAAGYVMKLEGSWRDASCRCKVDPGFKVLPSSTIVAQAPLRPENFVRIRFASDAKEETFDCRQNTCAAPINMSSAISRHTEPNALGELLRAAMDVVRENLLPGGDHSRTLSDFARSFSRGSNPFLSDAVVASDSNAVDVSSVFVKIPPASYAVEWCPID